MYRTEPSEKYYLKKAKVFMANTEKFAKAMQDVSEDWKNTMLHHLTNGSINKRAFLGQCACSYAINCPESIVRIAWKELTQGQRDSADLAAEEIINQYSRKINERQNKSVHHGLGVQVLLQWDSR